MPSPISVAPAKRWTFAVDLDNYGADSSGTWRLGALARLNSPFMIGDNLDVRVLASERLAELGLQARDWRAALGDYLAVKGYRATAP